MFENTLLIIKSDYMPRRKDVLQYLLCKGFLIQGNRKLAFTPEDAAEFYKDLADDKCYMLYVILLSKGTSEAFILTKLNAAEELVNTMICYFGTSVEMDRNVHVSRSVDAARREITFIFPNYIHEPIEYFDKYQFSKQAILAPLISEAYNIVKKPSTDQHADWRVQLSDWLLKTNSEFPQLSNQCSRTPKLGIQEKCQQTDLTMMKENRKETMEKAPILSTSTFSGATSDLLSSSSCVSCSSFKSVEPCPSQAQLDEFEKRLQLRATKTHEEPVCTTELAKQVCEEYIEWINVYEYEEGGESDEECKPMIDEKDFTDKNLDQIGKEFVAKKIEEKPCEAEEAVEPPPEESNLIIAETKSDEGNVAILEADKGEDEPVVMEIEPIGDIEVEAVPQAIDESEAGVENQQEIEPVAEPEPIPENEVEVLPEVKPEPESIPIAQEQEVPAEAVAAEVVALEKPTAETNAE